MRTSLQQPATLPFTKLHGLGNDFILIDSLEVAPESPLRVPGLTLNSELVRALSDRHRGVGCDQVLHLVPPRPSEEPQAEDRWEACQARMEVWNADGSRSGMCGNGIRAVALYLQSHGVKNENKYASQEMLIQTDDRVNLVRIPDSQTISVEMGIPDFPEDFNKLGQPRKVHAQDVHCFDVFVGNPHTVVFVEREDEYSIDVFGPALEHHPDYPDRTNVEFTRVEGPNSIHVKVWERGAGLTLACGSGACAAAVAAIRTERVRSPVDVFLPGGQLKIYWEGPGRVITMEGPAEEVFQGEFRISPHS